MSNIGNDNSFLSESVTKFKVQWHDEAPVAFNMERSAKGESKVYVPDHFSSNLSWRPLLNDA